MNIYKGKRIFITGHTGFKGSYLTAMLLRLGAVVKGYSHKNYFHLNTLFPYHNNSIYYKYYENLNSIYGDVIDRDKLTHEILDFDPDLIIHLAAQPLVRDSYRNPIETFQTNILGTMNVLEVCRNSIFNGSLLMITTDKVYKNLDFGVSYKSGYEESDELWGSDPYSSSKVCAEQIIDSYKKSYFDDDNILVAVARAGNVIGGGDFSKDRIIPDIMRAYNDNSVLILRNPNATRPYLHVLDVCYGYIQLGEKLLNKEKQFSDSWNFSPLKSMTTENVVKEIKKYCLLKYDVQEKKDNMKEAELLFLNSDKARNDLKWSPLYSIERSIEKTVEWYKEYYEDKVITMQQIDDYLDRI